MAFGRELDIDTTDGVNALIKGIQSYSLTIESGKTDLLFMSVLGRDRKDIPKKQESAKKRK